MNEVIDNIIVMGHENPDMDASAAAVGYAAFLNQTKRYAESAVGAVPSAITPQAKYVFDRAGVPYPLIVDDVSPRVGHVMQRDAISIRQDASLGEALETTVRKDLSMVPVVDEEERLSAVFSHRSDAARYLFGFDPTPFWGTLLRLEDIAAMPGMAVIGPNRAASSGTGEFRIAVTGCELWREETSSEDTVVCSHPSVFDDFAEARLPQAVVIVGDSDLAGSQSVARLHKNQVCVLQYGGSIVELVQQLTLQIPLGALSLPQPSCVGVGDKVSDIQSLLTDEHHALPAIDDDGKLVGVVSSRDLGNVATQNTKVIIVDHFESPQSVRGLEQSTIIEVVDHHRVGDVQTTQPIRVHCAPVGSSSTLVASAYFADQLDPPTGIATILLGGICADTLVLRGPTTTDIDRQIAARLAEIAGVDLDEFGTDVLLAADDLLTSEPREIWNRDQKQFHIRNRHFSVAQLETASLERVSDELLHQFETLVQADREERNDLLSVFVLTDVLRGDSIIFGTEEDESKQLIAGSFGGGMTRENWIAADGVVSRKKQVVPALMKMIALSS